MTQKDLTEIELDDMKNVWAWIISTFQKQGVSFILLAAMTYYFQSQTEALQNKTETCNERIIQLYVEQAEQTRKVIESNTEAVKNFSVYLRATTK